MSKRQAIKIKTTARKARVKKPNIPLKRRLITFYSRAILVLKLKAVILVLLMVFTTSLDFVKVKAIDFANNKAATLGFRLKNILIHGSINVPSKDILKAIKVKNNTPLFAVDLLAAKNNIEKNPWVKACAVERQLPDTIYISILERKPIAVWQINKKLFLIDAEGTKISDQGLEKFSSLIHVVGPEANIYAAQLIRYIENASPELLKKVESATRHGNRRWNINLEEDITVKLPEQNMKGAIQYLAKLHSNNMLFNQKYKTIDLRDGNRYYVEKHK